MEKVFFYTPKHSDTKTLLNSCREGNIPADILRCSLILATTQSRQKYWAASLYFPSNFSFGNADGPSDIKETTKHCMPVSLFLNIIAKEPEWWKREQMKTSCKIKAVQGTRELKEHQWCFLSCQIIVLIYFAEEAPSCSMLRHDIPSNYNQLHRTWLWKITIKVFKHALVYLGHPWRSVFNREDCYSGNLLGFYICKIRMSSYSLIHLIRWEVS